MSRSLKNYSPINVPRWQLTSSLQDRLQSIYGGGVPRPSLRLAQLARTYRELIRQYSNDSML